MKTLSSKLLPATLLFAVGCSAPQETQVPGEARAAVNQVMRQAPVVQAVPSETVVVTVMPSSSAPASTHSVLAAPNNSTQPVQELQPETVDCDTLVEIAGGPVEGCPEPVLPEPEVESDSGSHILNLIEFAAQDFKNTVDQKLSNYAVCWDDFEASVAAGSPFKNNQCIKDWYAECLDLAGSSMDKLNVCNTPYNRYVNYIRAIAAQYQASL